MGRRRRRRRRFVFYTLSPFIFNRRAELQRKLQTSRPLSCAEERTEPEQVAKANFLNEHYNQVHVRACVREFEQEPIGTLSVSFHLCVRSAAELKGQCVGLERQVSAHCCVAGQLWQTSLTNVECIILNILHLLQHCSSNQQHSLPAQKKGV